MTPEQIAAAAKEEATHNLKIAVRSLELTAKALVIRRKDVAKLERDQQRELATLKNLLNSYTGYTDTDTDLLVEADALLEQVEAAE